MWNNFLSIFRDTSYQRLGIAVVLSAILHFFLLDGINLRLTSYFDAVEPIQARIELTKAKPNPVETIKPESITPEPTPVKPEQLIEPPKEEAVAPQEAPVQPSPESQVVAEELAPQQPTENLPSQEATPQQTEETNKVLNENAYQYVETEFEVHTEPDGSAQGVAKITHEVVESNLYNLSFVIEPKGLFALFLGNLLQTSKGLLTSTGLQPNTYNYQYGDKTDKSRTANFDWQNKKLELITAKGSKIEELPEGTQDLLSFMYQFMYVPPLEKMQINIANGKKLTTYDYSFEGEEALILPQGEFRTIHIVHTGVNVDEKTELWLAIDYQHIPIKIVKTEKDGRYYEFIATRISTTRPTTQ